MFIITVIRMDRDYDVISRRVVLPDEEFLFQLIDEKAKTRRRRQMRIVIRLIDKHEEKVVFQREILVGNNLNVNLVRITY